MAMFFYYSNNVTVSDISKIEIALNFSLPLSYRNFLLNYGGIAVRDDSYATFNVDFLKPTTIEISTIFNPEDLIEYNSEFLSDAELDEKCIIIGEDSGGNFFILNNLGNVYYWDRTLIHQHLVNCSQKINIELDSNEITAIYFLFKNFDELFSIIKQSSAEQNSPFILKYI